MRLELQLDDGKPRQPMRILLVDDHAAVRQALAATFRQERGFRVVGQAGSLAEARGVLEGVDVAVIDLGLPDGSGADLIGDLRRASPRVDVLVLTASVDRASVAGAVHAGAAGAIGKSAGLHEVVDAVRRLRAGEALLPPAEVAELLRYERTRQEEERNERLAVGSLTPREGDVMQALADGLDSGGVARRLHITPRTERNHVANILAKLGVHSRLQALVMCLRYGLVQIHEA
jgi:DNA-binding NarL/FixJ family response regulator